jgi:DNA polymerase-1
LEEPDFFNYIATQMWDRPITKKDPERNLIKGVLYGRIYGAGAEKMALTAGVPITTIETVIGKFNSNFPGLTQLAKRIEKVAEERSRTEGRPYVKTPFGRKLYGDVDKEYALLNYELQGHAAELLKQGICDLDAAGLGPYLDLPVHDELIFEVEESEYDDVQHGIEEVLNNVGKDYFVPLTWGADKLGDRWGNKARQ